MYDLSTNLPNDSEKASHLPLLRSPPGEMRGQAGPTQIPGKQAPGTKGKHLASGGETALALYTMIDLRHEIENLSASEKADLLDVVWESLEADALSLTDAQRAELDHRIERYEQNPSDVIPWELVRADK
jgi:putative addiction module component (TIGR02574 family)